MITMKINEDDLLEMLMSRVEYWIEDEDIKRLYEKMYENYCYCGCFEGTEIDVNYIVDNDYVNWCRVVYESEEDFEELLEIYKEQGIGDCSCETNCCSYIESVDFEEEPKMFLVRY